LKKLPDGGEDQTSPGRWFGRGRGGCGRGCGSRCGIVPRCGRPRRPVRGTRERLIDGCDAGLAPDPHGAQGAGSARARHRADRHQHQADDPAHPIQARGTPPSSLHQAKSEGQFHELPGGGYDLQEVAQGLLDNSSPRGEHREHLERIDVGGSSQ